MSSEAKVNTDGYTNSIWNVLEPYMAGGKSIQGAMIFVTVEVIIGQAVRRLMKAPYNIRDSMEVHALSVPFLGQMNFGDAHDGLSGDPKRKVSFVDAMTTGGKQVPAAIVGYITQQLRRNGLRVPDFTNRDFLYLIVGKLLSRPALEFLFSSLPEDFQIAMKVLERVIEQQRAVVAAVKDYERDE
jgi:hypothetical protein